MARQLVQDGRCELVALTLGPAGAVFVWSDGVVRLPAPAVTSRSAVGAGDSFVGALALSLAEDRPLEEAFCLAVAAGAAALLTPATELCRREDVERLYAELRPTKAEADGYRHH